MKTLITGASGYIGNALSHSLKSKGKDFLGVDSGAREQWVTEVGGKSLTEYPTIPFLFCNVAMKNDLVNVLQYYRPDTIVHLASQPSGPYSQLNYDKRIFTQQNNLLMLLNLLAISKEMGLDCKFIVTTTTGVPGAPGEPIVEDHMPNLAGSCYHISRGFDSANLSLAARQWKMRLLEIRTSIVYGTRINGINEPITRLDWDFCFGTAIHRFILRKKLGLPITIYGKGLQMKPIISLRDTIESLEKAIESDIPIGHEIMNQTTQCVSVVKMAEEVGGEITHIPNPRVEKEDYQMTIHNQKFLKLLPNYDSKRNQLFEEVHQIENDMDLNLLPINWLTSYEGK